MRSRRFLVMLLAFASIWLATPPAGATTCVKPELARSTRDADVIFVGTAGSSTGIPGGSRTPFRVTRVFKGTAPGAVAIDGGGMMGATFQAGKSYLVFVTLPKAGEASTRPFADLCGGSQLATEAEAWIAALGEGDAPAKAGSPMRSGNEGASPPEAPPPAETATPAASASPPEARVDPSSTATPVPSPSPPSTPPPQGGCGGCATASDQRFDLAWAWILGVLVAVRGARRGARPARR